ncbi:MAG TPA: RNA polymerase factor sigma-32 [Acidobacteriota bacterium]|nr:RNA polymerase factor sigma-32 [Acidobacteriota bacterium]
MTDRPPKSAQENGGSQEAKEAKEAQPVPQIPAPASTGSAQLAKLDPLRKYLLEISQFEPLSAEEERELAERYREDEDEYAAMRLVTANLRLVVKIAMMYKRVYSNVLDLIQEGNIGLMEAVKRFDPDKGARLPTYASWWIKAYIIKFMLDNLRIVRAGTTNERRRLIFNLRKEKEKLRLQGIDPTPKLIAERLDVEEDTVRELQPFIESSELSLDAKVGEDSPLTYVDTLTDTEAMVDERLAQGELRQLFEDKLDEFAQTLSEREHMILYKRLMAEDPLTLQEIADQYGVTREAIRLNEKSLIAKIKEFMEHELEDVTHIEFGLVE